MDAPVEDGPTLIGDPLESDGVVLDQAAQEDLPILLPKDRQQSSQSSSQLGCWYQAMRPHPQRLGPRKYNA